MDLSKILANLRQERQQVEESIVALERLAGGTRGLPSGWVRAHKRRGPPSSGSGSSVGGSGCSGTCLPSYALPRHEDGPTRRRRTLNPDLKR